jgi:hypothetical protein
MVAFDLVSDVQAFIFLNKDHQEVELVDKMVASVIGRVLIFHKIAQYEVTKCLQKIIINQLKSLAAGRANARPLSRLYEYKQLDNE